MSDSAGRLTGRMAGKDSLAGVDQWGRVVDGGGSLTKSDGDQRDFPLVGRDVASCINPLDICGHGGVHQDPTLVQVKSPLSQWTDVGDEA